MNRKTGRITVLLGTMAFAAVLVCGGCGNDGGNNHQLKLSPIYESALWGAAIGGIIGYQSDEAGEGAALGAAIFGIGALLQQTDDMAEEDREHEDEHEEQEEIVLQITNEDGSLTPVVLEKKAGGYSGPNGENYEHLPSVDQLRQTYGK